MKFPRRTFLRLAASASAIPALPHMASALDYPTRPVHLIVPFAPGGTTDIVARLVGQSLSNHFHQPFVIENRAGANGSIATETVVRAPADGYTLVMINTGTAINVSLYNNLNFNLVNDIAPVANVFSVSFVIVVSSSVSAKSLPDFIAYAKANPAKVNMASGGNGSPSQVSGELFKMMAGVDMLDVPYRGDGPAIAALLGGQAQVMFAPVPASIAHIRAGKLRALAVTATKRLDVLPDTPTVAESVPGYEASAWQGVGAAKATPADVIDGLNREINSALATPEMKTRFADLGGGPMPMSPADFGKFIVSETRKWGKVVRAAQIKVE